MSEAISFVRPQINTEPTVTGKATADNLKAELNSVDSDLKNYQISDIAAMTKRTSLESKLSDTKVAPVKFVDDIKTVETNETDEISGGYAANPDFENAVKSLRESKQYSLNDKERMLTDQMNQMALNNKILHGLLV